MKKILFFIALLFSVCSYGQVKQVYNQYGGDWKKFYIRQGLRLPQSPVSTKDLNLPAMDTGQIYYNPADSSIYYHTGFQWIKAGAGGGGSSGGITSIGAGLCITIVNDSTVAVDTACIADYFVRLSDSNIVYVTPHSLDSAMATTGSGTVTDVTASSPIRITGTSTITPNVVVDTSQNAAFLVNHARLKQKLDSISRSVDSLINLITLLTKNVPGNASAKAISFVDNDTLKLKGLGNGLFTLVTTRSDSAILVNLDTNNAALHALIALYGNDGAGGLVYAGHYGDGVALMWLDTIYHRIAFKDTTDNFIRWVGITDSLDGTNYDVDAQAYIDAVNATDITLTVPQKQAINDLVEGIKADGDWAEYYDIGLPLWGTAASSAVMLKLTHTVTWVNSPTFGSTGVTGNGSSMYGNLNFSPATAYSSANDAHLSVYIQNNVTDVNQTDIGSNDGSAIRINSRAGSATQSFLNDATNSAATVASSVGLTLLTRTSSSNVATYKNGSFVSNASSTSTTRSTENIYILAGNQVGSPGIYSTRTMSAWTIGGTLTGTQVGNLSTRLNAFMTALGINVY